MMNEKAEEIGMTSTNFTIHRVLMTHDNISTVRDIALMSKYLIQNYPIFYELFAKKLYLGQNGWRTNKTRNRNPLLYKNI